MAVRAGPGPGPATSRPDATVVEAEPAVPDALADLPPALAGTPHRPRRRWTKPASYLVTVFFLLTLNFFLPRTMPGDPASAMLGEGRPSSSVNEAEAKRALLARYGLDAPLPVQYGRYLAALARGDLGTSMRHNVPVRTLIAQRMPWTALLAGCATALALAAGLVAGVASGWRRGRRADKGLLVLFLAIRNVPPFFFASLVLLLFSVKLGWFPLTGATTAFSSFEGLSLVADVAHHLALPVGVLAVQFAGGYYLLMRAGMVSELGADYLLVGRAKGLTERRLKYGYAARNALAPVVSVGALQLSFALTGSIFIERIFAYPGIGNLAFQAIASRDYPTVQGTLLVFTLVIVTLNYLADALHRRLDPRVAG